jgi:hypothetical protein
VLDRLTRFKRATFGKKRFCGFICQILIKKAKNRKKNWGLAVLRRLAGVIAAFLWKRSRICLHLTIRFFLLSFYVPDPCSVARKEPSGFGEDQARGHPRIDSFPLWLQPRGDWLPLEIERVTRSVWKFDGNKKFGGKRIRHILQNLKKFGEIQENSTEMHLMGERNRNFLKTQKLAELANNSAEWTVNL